MHGKRNLVDACKLVEHGEKALQQSFHAIVVFFPYLSHQEVAEFFKRHLVLCLALYFLLFRRIWLFLLSAFFFTFHLSLGL